MCGICFICAKSQEGQTREDLMLALDENTLLCDPLLHHRGPDVSRNHLVSLVENLSGYMQGCVLHLRGSLTPQPVTDARGNAFLWNGEVFDGIQVEEHENDTQVLFGHLINCLTEEDVLKTMQKVHGPWAFIFWQAVTRKLWFGRDLYGRRSLMWHLPLSTSDDLVLTSVALGEMAYTEIPSVGIFCLDYSQVTTSSTDASHCPELTLYPWKNCRWPGTSVSVTETEEKNMLAYLYPNLLTCISVHIDRTSILDSWIPDINKHLPTADASSLDNSIDLTKCASLEDMLINILNTRSDLDALADELIRVLQSSVDKRVRNLPRNPSSSHCPTIGELKKCGSACRNHVSICAGHEGEVRCPDFNERELPASQANVALLFSGGLDSTVLAALADRCVPEGEPIDLLNVAFEQLVAKNIIKTTEKQKKQTSFRKTKSRHQYLAGKSTVEICGLHQIKLLESKSNSSEHHCEHIDICNSSESHLPKNNIILNESSAGDLSTYGEKLSEPHLQKDETALTGCSAADLSIYSEYKSSEPQLPKVNIILNGCNAANLSTYEEKSIKPHFPNNDIALNGCSAAESSRYNGDKSSESHPPKDHIVLNGCSAADLSTYNEDKSSESHPPKDHIVLNGCSAADLFTYNEDKSSESHPPKDHNILNGCSAADLSTYNEDKSSESHPPKDHNILNGSSAADLSTYKELPSSVLHSLVSEQSYAGNENSRHDYSNSSSCTENHSKNIISSDIDVKFNVPDRQTGLLALSELNPKRVWNFVEINISQAELQDLRTSHIRKLIYPLQTVLDDSIGCAVWFAARGSGAVPHKNEKFVSKAKVVLCGMAADEQFAGYSRHRVTFQTKGWEGLLKEIQEEMWRISARNLGRDDRIITDHGKECRFPFLDETFTQFVSALPLCQRADLRLPRGVGDKLLLRLCAIKLGLIKTASQPKRAIQFGSRIAKLDRRKEKGSDVCDRLV